MNDNKNLALVFPGQGAQFPGMGKELYETSQAARKIFDAAEAIRKGTITQCFEATKEELSQTNNTQPCIFTVSLAYAASLEEQGKRAAVTAGFSVGEVAALTYAGVFSFEDGFKAVIKRAELMSACAAKTKGTMAAVLKLDAGKVEELCKEHGVFAVNYNCPGQIVASGEENAMAAFVAKVNASGGRAMPLAVSGAFHSPLMTEAADEFRKYLESISISAPKISVYANLTAKPYEGDIKDIFAKQIKSPVLWEQAVTNMLAHGITEFIEAEPGKVLTGLISKIRSK
ncbi:MAG: ACP S-malonyltransferase [Spirochaetes bacterium]|nr:ACP S-malonyltransferase [Spirochaetota bacterium]